LKKREKEWGGRERERERGREGERDREVAREWGREREKMIWYNTYGRAVPDGSRGVLLEENDRHDVHDVESDVDPSLTVIW
jgi:hypothetical protein